MDTHRENTDTHTCTDTIRNTQRGGEFTHTTSTHRDIKQTHIDDPARTHMPRDTQRFAQATYIRSEIQTQTHKCILRDTESATQWKTHIHN